MTLQDFFDTDDVNTLNAEQMGKLAKDVLTYSSSEIINHPAVSCKKQRLLEFLSQFYKVQFVSNLQYLSKKEVEQLGSIITDLQNHLK